MAAGESDADALSDGLPRGVSEPTLADGDREGRIEADRQLLDETLGLADVEAEYRAERDMDVDAVNCSDPDSSGLPVSALEPVDVSVDIKVSDRDAVAVPDCVAVGNELAAEETEDDEDSLEHTVIEPPGDRVGVAGSDKDAPTEREETGLDETVGALFVADKVTATVAEANGVDTEEAEAVPASTVGLALDDAAPVAVTAIEALLKRDLVELADSTADKD